MVYLSGLVYSLQFVTNVSSVSARTGLNMAEYTFGGTFDLFDDRDLPVIDKSLDKIAWFEIGLSAQLNRDRDLSFTTDFCHYFCWTSFHSVQPTLAFA